MRINHHSLPCGCRTDGWPCDEHRRDEDRGQSAELASLPPQVKGVPYPNQPTTTGMVVGCEWPEGLFGRSGGVLGGPRATTSAFFGGGGHIGRLFRF